MKPYEPYTVFNWSIPSVAQKEQPQIRSPHMLWEVLSFPDSAVSATSFPGAWLEVHESSSNTKPTANSWNVMRFETEKNDGWWCLMMFKVVLFNWDKQNCKAPQMFAQIGISISWTKSFAGLTRVEKRAATEAPHSPGRSSGKASRWHWWGMNPAGSRAEISWEMFFNIGSILCKKSCVSWPATSQKRSPLFAGQASEWCQQSTWMFSHCSAIDLWKKWPAQEVKQWCLSQNDMKVAKYARKPNVQVGD